jgi:hypothetical protein
MVSVLALDAKVRGFKSCRFDEFLKVMKIRSTISFGGEVNQEDPRKILRHVKIICKYEKIFGNAKSIIPSPVSHACYQMSLLVGLPVRCGGRVRIFLFHRDSTMILHGRG